MDAPPPPPADNSVKRYWSPGPSGQLRSGHLGRPSDGDDDDEDPFVDEDAPADDYFKRGRLRRLIILEWASLIIILAVLACSLSVAGLRRKALWGLHICKWELLVLVLVSGCVIRVAVFFLERSFLLRKRVLYFVYGVRKSVRNCLWLSLVVLAWSLLFDKKVQRQTQSQAVTFVSKILFCFSVSTLFWLAKTILVKALASSFHVSTYFERIQENLFNQYVIQILSGPPLVEILHTEDDDRLFAEVEKLQSAEAAASTELRAATRRAKISQIGKIGRYSQGNSNEAIGWRNEEGITINHLHKLNQRNVSAWNMKRLMKMVRHGRLTLLDEQMPNAREEDESMTEIQSEFEGKAAAKKIFRNVAMPGAM